MKQEIDPKDTSRAIAFELWTKSPMPMVTLTKMLIVPVPPIMRIFIMRQCLSVLEELHNVVQGPALRAVRLSSSVAQGDNGHDGASWVALSRARTPVMVTKLNYILAIGYPNEQPDAKPRDASKVKYIK